MRVANLIDAAPGSRGSPGGSLRLIGIWSFCIPRRPPCCSPWHDACCRAPGCKGILFGGLLFLVFLVAQLGPEMLLVKFLFALVSIVYGVTLAFLVTALEARARRWPRCPSSDQMACQAGRCSRRARLRGAGHQSMAWMMTAWSSAGSSAITPNCAWVTSGSKVRNSSRPVGEIGERSVSPGFAAEHLVARPERWFKHNRSACRRGPADAQGAWRTPDHRKRADLHLGTPTAAVV
jgi:hypothetical protein